MFDLLHSRSAAIASLNLLFCADRCYLCPGEFRFNPSPPGFSATRHCFCAKFFTLGAVERPEAVISGEVGLEVDVL